MSGMQIGVLILAWVLAGSPQERPISVGHSGPHYIVRMVPRASPWDHGKRKIKVVELGHSERIVYQGPWEGDDEDFDGMVREAKRMEKR